MRFIESRQNKRVKEILSLKNKKNRRMQQCFLVEGLRFIREALISGSEVIAICFSSEIIEKLNHDEIEFFKNTGAECFAVPESLFRQMAETDSPQGIMGMVRMNQSALVSLYRKGFRGIILDTVQDPGNAGTIIRSAHAMGFDAVVATKGTVDIFNSKVLRSTMGSLFYIPVIDGVDKNELISFCSEHRVRMITTQMVEGKPCYDLNLSGDFFLVIGNEGKGVSLELDKVALESCYIPMPGDAESLNAAIAASILMYESNRQHKDKP